MKQEPGTCKRLGIKFCFPFLALGAVAVTIGGFIIGVIPALLIRKGLKLSDRGVSWPPA